MGRISSALRPRRWPEGYREPRHGLRMGTPRSCRSLYASRQWADRVWNRESEMQIPSLQPEDCTPLATALEFSREEGKVLSPGSAREAAGFNDVKLGARAGPWNP